MSSYRNTKQLSIQEFLNIPPVKSQRSVESHSGKIKKFLKENSYKQLPTLLDVQIAVFPDGDQQLLNGNTRSYIWSNPAKFGVDVPMHVRAHYYNVVDEQDAVNLYLSFDNQKASETGNDKITGAFRMNDMDIVTPPFKSGNIMSALLAACRGRSIDTKDIYAMVSYYKNEIVMIDKLDWRFRGTKSSMKTTWPSIVAGSLMMLKKYGTNNDVLNEMLGRLASNKGGGNVSKDAVDVILNVWQTGRGKGVNFATDTNSGEHLTLQLDFILYCLEKGVTGEKVVRMGSKMKDVYVNFWKVLPVTQSTKKVTGYWANPEYYKEYSKTHRKNNTSVKGEVL